MLAGSCHHDCVACAVVAVFSVGLVVHPEGGTVPVKILSVLAALRESSQLGAVGDKNLTFFTNSLLHIVRFPPGYRERQCCGHTASHSAISF